MAKEVLIIKSTGAQEIFRPEKLHDSLVHSGAGEKAAKHVLLQIENELRDGMTTTQIYSHAFALLRKEGSRAIARYSLKRALLSLGPSGFPFEKFVAEILKTKGYETAVGQIVKGHCVDHEMDVVAWKGNELIMIEAKFHHEIGMKSDIKVALYIKSRFEDLRTETFTFGGKQFKFGEGWLVTNTKFSDQAKRYAECQGLKLIGWNYPAKGNLEDLVSEANLHPLTCLTTLSEGEKQSLLQNGLVLCRQVVDKKNELPHLGVPPHKVDQIMKEAAFLCTP